MNPTTTVERTATGVFARCGACLFRHRNVIFPVVMAVFLAVDLTASSASGDRKTAYALGLTLLAIGQAVRVLVVGLAYVKRGGMNKRVYAAELVTAGMFAHSRNPLYLANLLIAAGLLALTGNSALTVAGTTLFAVGYTAIIAAEEDYLLARFGRSYRTYCSRVPRWLPRLRGLRSTVRSLAFDWRRVVLKEYPTLATNVTSTCAIVAAQEIRAAGLDSPLAAAMGLVVLLALAGALMVRRVKKAWSLRRALV